MFLTEPFDITYYQSINTVFLPILSNNIFADFSPIFGQIFLL